MVRAGIPHIIMYIAHFWVLEAEANNVCVTSRLGRGAKAGDQSKQAHVNTPRFPQSPSAKQKTTMLKAPTDVDK